jgi:hypothetical protein
MLEIKCQKMFGMVPDDLAIEFKPLRILSAEGEENVKTQKYTRLIQAKQTGEISTQEFRDACNKGNLFDIRLDTEQDPGGISGEVDASDADSDPYETTDVDDPGANRADTRKTRATKIGGISKEPPSPKSADAPAGKAEAPIRGEGPRGVGGALDSPDEPGDVAVKKKVKNFSPQWVQGKKELALVPMPAPWALASRLTRILRNSPEFDRASYEADGGDSWIDPRRREFFENPGSVDEGIWAKAKEASQAALGEIRWQFVTWWYKKQGGKFH